MDLQWIFNGPYKAFKGQRGDPEEEAISSMAVLASLYEAMARLQHTDSVELINLKKGFWTL